MKKKDFIRIINEEIVGFDFLSNEEYIKEEENLELIKNEDFQKQFITDSITKFKEKIKIIETDAAFLGEPNWEDNWDDVTLEYFITIKYNYMGKELEVGLNFFSDALTLSWTHQYDAGTHDIPAAGNTWIDGVDWDDISVELLSNEGEVVEFNAFERAGGKTKELFIRAYTEDIIREKVDAGWNLR